MNEQQSVREKISLADVVPYFFGLEKNDFESLSLVSKAVRSALRDIVVHVDGFENYVVLHSTKEFPWDLPLRCISFSTSSSKEYYFYGTVRVTLNWVGVTLDSIDVRKVSFSHSTKIKRLKLHGMHDLHIDGLHSIRKLHARDCSRLDLSQLVSSSGLVELILYNVEVVAARTLDVPPTLKTLSLSKVHGLQVQKLHLLNSRLSELRLEDSTGMKIDTVPVDVWQIVICGCTDVSFGAMFTAVWSVTIKNSTGKIVDSTDSIETSCLATQFLFYGRSLSCRLINLLPTDDDRNTEVWAGHATTEFLSAHPGPVVVLELENVPVKKLELEAYNVSLSDSKDIKEVRCCLDVENHIVDISKIRLHGRPEVRLNNLRNLQTLSLVSFLEMPICNEFVSLTLESLPMLTTVDIPSQIEEIRFRNVGLETLVISGMVFRLDIADMQQLQSITFNDRGVEYVQRTSYRIRNCPKLVEVVALGHARHVPGEILEFANTQAQGNPAAPIQNFNFSKF